MPDQEVRVGTYTEREDEDGYVTNWQQTMWHHGIYQCQFRPRADEPEPRAYQPPHP